LDGTPSTSMGRKTGRKVTTANAYAEPHCYHGIRQCRSTNAGIRGQDRRFDRVSDHGFARNAQSRFVPNVLLPDKAGLPKKWTLRKLSTADVHVGSGRWHGLRLLHQPGEAALIAAARIQGDVCGQGGCRRCIVGRTGMPTSGCNIPREYTNRPHAVSLVRGKDGYGGIGPSVGRATLWLHSN